jgi:SHS2 domain-containing protein
MMPENDPIRPLKTVQFEEIEHTADVALRVRGQSWNQLLQNAALGMASLIHNPSEVYGEVIERLVDVFAEDPEGLLVEWLSELAYLAETESLVFDSCEFKKVDKTRISALVQEKKVRELKTHIKAVTYHHLQVLETSSGFEATVVFDL